MLVGRGWYWHEDDYEAMLKRSWSFSEGDKDNPVLVVRPLGNDDGPLSDGWWMRTGKVFEHTESQGGCDEEDEKDNMDGGSIAA